MDDWLSREEEQLCRVFLFFSSLHNFFCVCFLFFQKSDGPFGTSLFVGNLYKRNWLLGFSAKTRAVNLSSDCVDVSFR